MSLQVAGQFPDAPTPVGNSRLILVTTILAAITFGPALVFYRFTVSSHAVGLMLSCALVIGLWFSGFIRLPAVLSFRTWFVVTALVALASTAHLVIAAFLVDVVVSRALQSNFLLAVALLGALIVSGLLECEDNVLPQATRVIRLLFIAFGILGALRLQPLGASIALSAEKSVFPFTEPSQFTIAFSPFLIHAVATSRRWVMRYLWLGVGLGLAIVLQNLSMVVLTAVAAVLCLPVWQAIAAIAALFPITAALDLDYYTQRLDLSLQSQSYSGLIYRQGWELTVDALTRSSGWGIGFQQLGYVPFNSFSADLLRVAIGVDSNVVDGGFTTAKLLSEFGIFGILAVSAYLFLAARSSLLLRKQINPHVPRLSSITALAHSSVCGVVIDLFIRGEGYFSGSILLFEASLFILWRTRSERRTRDHLDRQDQIQALFPVAIANN